MTVLVVGATGELGGALARALVARGVTVRAMTRRSGAVDVDGAETVTADLRDRESLARAFRGVQRAFIVSSPAPYQVELETNAIDAAESAGVEHLVKVANLPVAGLETGLHGNHRAIERRLAASAVAATVLQPSFFTSVLRRQAALLARGRLVLPTGSGRIAWIDPRDIALVAAEVLAAPAPPGGVLRLTGPEALDASQLAARVGAVTGHEVKPVQPGLDRWRSGLLAGGMDPWLVDSTVHLYEAVARGALDTVLPDVERTLGRPPRPVDDWLRDELAPFLAELPGE